MNACVAPASVIVTDISPRLNGEAQNLHHSHAKAIVDWVAEINLFLDKHKPNTLKLARIVNAAKEKLRYGEWTALWQSGQIPFSKRKAEMLVVIGARLNWIDAKTSAQLPTGWNTLYFLARLERAEFEKLLMRRAIHPALTLREAKAFLAASQGHKERRRNPNLNHQLKKFRDFVRANVRYWSSRDREMAQIELRQLVDEIGRVALAPGRARVSPSRLAKNCSTSFLNSNVPHRKPDRKRNSAHTIL